MMEWEYLRSSMNEFGSIDERYLEQWNDLGREGWELVSVVRNQSQTIGYFKRVKSTDAEV